MMSKRGNLSRLSYNKMIMSLEVGKSYPDRQDPFLAFLSHSLYNGSVLQALPEIPYHSLPVLSDLSRTHRYIHAE